MDRIEMQYEAIRIRQNLRRRMREDGENDYKAGKIIDNSSSYATIKSKGNMDGGPGSGNHGHEGVPGQRGGSAPTGSIGHVATGKSGTLTPKSDGARTISTSDAMQEIKDGRHNSLEEHMDENGNLSPERQKVHDTIIRDFFADKEPADGQPTLVMSGGGPASGKTFVRKDAESQFGENTTVTIDPDKFKEALPGYSEMAKNDEGAAGFYHEESSALAKRAYQFAADNGINVVYDGTGDGSVKSVESKLKIAQDAGYKVEGKYVTVDTDEALRRNQQRYENAKVKFDKGESDVPPRLPREDVVVATHQKVSDISLDVAGKFDNFELYDNNGPRGSAPVKIATCKKGGEITAVPGKEKELQKYIDKGKSGAKVVNGKVVRR